MKPKILITGATGTTSQYAIQNLLDKGIHVRALVRTFDQRSDALRRKGVEVVKGDFLDLQSLRNTLQGIERAYFLYPFMDHLPKAVAYFAKAAKENDIKQIVSMSQMNVHENATSPATQNHLMAEEILDWADLGAVHIRPALFAWNYLGMAASSVANERKFYFPSPEARYSIVHPQDVGEVVASLLTDPKIERHTGKRYVLTGGRTYNNQEVTTLIETLLNDPVEYIPIPVENWVDTMSTLPNVNSFLATHLKELIKDIESGKFDNTTNSIKKITGHEPRSFKEYLEENKEVFNVL